MGFPYAQWCAESAWLPAAAQRRQQEQDGEEGGAQAGHDGQAVLEEEVDGDRQVLRTFRTFR